MYMERVWCVPSCSHPGKAQSWCEALTRTHRARRRWRRRSLGRVWASTLSSRPRCTLRVRTFRVSRRPGIAKEVVMSLPHYSVSALGQYKPYVGCMMTGWSGPTRWPTWSTPMKWPIRKSHAWAWLEFAKRGKRLSMTPLSTVCKSSMLKESKSCGIFGWKAVGQPVSQVSSPTKPIYHRGLVRTCEEASSGEMYRFVSLLQLLYDRALPNRCPTNVITNIDEC